MRKALVVFAIGEKYTQILKQNKTQFINYAKKNDADFIIVDDFLDKTQKRNVLYQKLLIPNHFKQYDLVLFLDLDIIISKKCPSIFDLLPEDKGFGAVLSPRNKKKYKLHYSSRPEILNETVETYFTSRNFVFENELEKQFIIKNGGNINGGVLIFRPKLISELFYNYYYSNHLQGEKEAFEEAPMSFLSQKNHLFFSIDEKYNTEFFFEYYEDRPISKKIYRIKSNTIYKIINRILIKIFKIEPDSLLYAYQKKLKKELLEDVYILHFSGFVSEKLYTKN